MLKKIQNLIGIITLFTFVIPIIPIVIGVSCSIYSYPNSRHGEAPVPIVIAKKIEAYKMPDCVGSYNRICKHYECHYDNDYNKVCEISSISINNEDNFVFIEKDEWNKIKF